MFSFNLSSLVILFSKLGSDCVGMASFGVYAGYFPPDLSSVILI